MHPRLGRLRRRDPIRPLLLHRHLRRPRPREPGHRHRYPDHYHSRPDRLSPDGSCRCLALPLALARAQPARQSVHATPAHHDYLRELHRHGPAGAVHHRNGRVDAERWPGSCDEHDGRDVESTIDHLRFLDFLHCQSFWVWARCESFGFSVDCSEYQLCFFWIVGLGFLEVVGYCWGYCFWSFVLDCLHLSLLFWFFGFGFPVLLLSGVRLPWVICDCNYVCLVYIDVINVTQYTPPYNPTFSSHGACAHT